MKTFKTPKGTELPLLNLKGKDYLQVQHRLVWFREEKPDWSIQTECFRLADDMAVFRATILNQDGRIIAQGTKSETASGFPDFIEKAESGSIGRALAMCGYGTQFTTDLDEGDRIVDSPVQPKEKPSEPGAYIIRIGKEMKGMRLDACDLYKLSSFSDWLASQPKLEGLGLETREAIELFLKTREFKRTK